MATQQSQKLIQSYIILFISENPIHAPTQLCVTQFSFLRSIYPHFASTPLDSTREFFSFLHCLRTFLVFVFMLFVFLFFNNVSLFTLHTFFVVWMNRGFLRCANLNGSNRWKKKRNFYFLFAHCVRFCCYFRFDFLLVDDEEDADDGLRWFNVSMTQMLMIL